MKLLWKDSYSVGNQDIDEQHKRWIDYYNQLDDVMTGNSRRDLSATRANILKEMSDYVDYHFHFEEEYMRSIGYPEIDSHWRQHKNFRNQIYRVCRDHLEGTVLLSSEILDMIRTWLIEHIIKEDGKISEYLKTEKERDDTTVQ